MIRVQLDESWIANLNPITKWLYWIYANRTPSLSNVFTEHWS